MHAVRLAPGGDAGGARGGCARSVGNRGGARSERGKSVVQPRSALRAISCRCSRDAASDLLVELMMPPDGCAEETTEVRQTQAPVTSQQAPTNQNEYLAMGERARALEMRARHAAPVVRRYGRRARRGGRRHSRLAEMIARLSAGQAEKLSTAMPARTLTAERPSSSMVGCCTTTSTPPRSDERGACTPRSTQRLRGKLVAVNLVVPGVHHGRRVGGRPLPGSHITTARVSGPRRRSFASRSEASSSCSRDAERERLEWASGTVPSGIIVNYGKSWRFAPAAVAYPADAEDLARRVRGAGSLRAMGSRHSSSEASSRTTRSSLWTRCAGYST